ncbi:MAG: hypothetical protein Q8T08_24965 [Ignavibacteria bacterium]|nr:hypothetical protein [Ignavibacteria bacterium]
MSNEDNQKEIEEVDEELKLELSSQYYNVMGCLLFKQEYIDAVNEKEFDKLIYFVMRLNVSNTH